jgi:hypothetical protein
MTASILKETMVAKETMVEMVANYFVTDIRVDYMLVGRLDSSALEVVD